MATSQSTFGTIQFLDPAPITVIFIIVLIILTVFEYSFKILRYFAEKHDQLELLDKLQHELMVLGLISFLIFLVEQAAILQNATTFLNSEYYLSFEYAHIIILFIALSFIAQALVLVHFARNAGLEFLRTVRTSEVELLDEYARMRENKRRIRGRAQRARYWKRVELKIIQELFLVNHAGKIPLEFDFGYYVGYLYKTYIAEAGEVSASAWFSLAVVIILNFAKTALDNKVESTQCGLNSSRRLTDGSSADFTNDSGIHCYEFLLSYAMVGACALNLAILGVYIASAYYVHALVRQGILTVFDKDIEIHNSFLTVVYHSLLEAAGAETLTPSHKATHAAYLSCLEKLYSGAGDFKSLRIRSSAHIMSPSDSVTLTPNPVLENSADPASPSASAAAAASSEEAHKSLHTSTGAQSQSVEEAMQTMKHDKERLLHEEELDRSRSPWQHRLWHKLKTALQSPVSDFDDLFFLRSTGLYFFAVQFVFLLQSFYIALYLTQLLPIAVAVQAPGWATALAVMPLIGFYLLRLTLTKSVLLHSTTSLHKEVFGRVCEESLEVKRLTTQVRAMILQQCVDRQSEGQQGAETTPSQKVGLAMSFKTAMVGNSARVAMVKRQFDLIDKDGSGEIDRFEFRQFLGSLNIYLSRERFDLLWRVVDNDLSGTVNKDEILVFLFPEEKGLLRAKLKVVYELRRAFLEAFRTMHLLEEDWERHIQDKFKYFDVDGSGYLDRFELQAMAALYDIKISDRLLASLMASVDPNPQGISYAAFQALLFPTIGISPSKERDSRHVISVGSIDNA